MYNYKRHISDGNSHRGADNQVIYAPASQKRHSRKDSSDHSGLGFSIPAIFLLELAFNKLFLRPRSGGNSEKESARWRGKPGARCGSTEAAILVK